MGIPIHQNYHYSASSSLSSNDSHHQTTLSLFGGGGGSTLESRRLMEPPPTFSSLNRLLELASGGTGGSRQTIRNRHNYVSSSLDIQPTFATADPPLRSGENLFVSNLLLSRREIKV